MTVIWMKLVHIVAVSVWAGGLLALPLMLAQGAVSRNPRRTVATARHLYVAFLSPAAAVAVLSGGVLMARGGIHTDWFAAKLTFTAVLSVLHVLAARQVVAGLGPQGADTLFLRASSVVTGAVVLAIAGIVLAKPGATYAFRCDGPGEVRILILDQGSARSSCGPAAMP